MGDRRTSRLRLLKPLLQVLGVVAVLLAVFGGWLWLSLPRGSNDPPAWLYPSEQLAGPGDQRLVARARAVFARLPKRGFTVVTEPPFVVVGDEAPVVVRKRAQTTIRWAVRRLKQDYFERDPNEIITIFLLKDDAAYQRVSRKLFGVEPSTPFGYYDDRHEALVMNIATGGGTLIHEIVHPFVDASFPGCPAWFNEGLASLYEACNERDGKIVGTLNWRLPGLQRVIRAGELPPFEDLVGSNRHEFYMLDAGDNYAQARYLLYFMERKGLLRHFYREFLANRARDPTGWATLKRVLGVTDMAAFQKAWEAWVLELDYTD